MRLNQDIFAEKLASLMEQRKISKYQLAKDLSFSQTSIANWLNKTTAPSKRSLEAIARYFGVSIYDLGAVSSFVASWQSFQPGDDVTETYDEYGNTAGEIKKAPAAEAEDALPEDIRMIARAGKRMEPEKRAEMVRILKAIFPEEFKE